MSLDEFFVWADKCFGEVSDEDFNDLYEQMVTVTAKMNDHTMMERLEAQKVLMSARSVDHKQTVLTLNQQLI